MMDIPNIMKKLAERRPIFHSEADFQHEFAWSLREAFPSSSDFKVRLEHPLHHPSRNAVDILCKLDKTFFAIELKYLCKQVNVLINDEDFNLKSQGAQDIRRYDVFKDVERMEKFMERRPGAHAAVIVLSNDNAFWTGPKKDNTCDAKFALKEGRKVTGNLKWADHAGPGTTKSREQEICLKKNYEVAWHDYSKVSEKSGHFKFLHIPIPAHADKI